MKIEVPKENLEGALGKMPHEHAKKEKCHEDCKCDNNEEIGFHKGCLNTLVGERNELIKMIQQCEAIMQAHIKRLTELGVKIQAEGNPQGKA